MTKASVMLLYIARRSLGPFAVLTAVLLFALTLERVLNLVQIVTTLGAPVYSVLELISYLLPHYLGLAIPAAWFMAVMIGMRSLQRDSELMVMRASGRPLWQLASPLVTCSLALVLIMAILTGYLQPYSRHAYRDRLEELKSSDFWTKLQPGVFAPVSGEQNVVRVDSVTDEGRSFEGFFASYQKPGERNRIYVSARTATLSGEEGAASDADLQLNLKDGMIVNRIVGDDGRESIQTLAFGSLPWKLSETGLVSGYGPRGQDEREMTFGELLEGNAPAAAVVSTAKPRRLAEFHSRIVQCVSLPFLTILAVPLALLGRGRASRAYGFPLGIILIVLFQKLLSTGEGYGKLGQLPPGLGVWTTLLGLALIAFLAFHWFGGDRRSRKCIPPPATSETSS